MNENARAEKLLDAWITLGAIIKKSRITKELFYNESIVMNILYKSFIADGIGIVAVKEITQKTGMLKSQVNRTINSLGKKGFLERCEMPGDKRAAYVKCKEDKLNIFLKIHKKSLAHADAIIKIVGKEDAELFINMVNKIEKSGYCVI